MFTFLLLFSKVCPCPSFIFKLVHVYCGRRTSGYWHYNENYWQSEKGFLRPSGLKGERCLPLLFNQPFKVGYYGLLPNIFEDRTNQSVSGTDVEAIRLLADKYRMKLKFQAGDGGDYVTITSRNATHNLARVTLLQFLWKN